MSDGVEPTLDEFLNTPYVLSVILKHLVSKIVFYNVLINVMLKLCVYVIDVQCYMRIYCYISLFTQNKCTCLYNMITIFKIQYFFMLEDFISENLRSAEQKV